MKRGVFLLLQSLQDKNQKLAFARKIFNVLKDKAYLYNEPYLKEYVSPDGIKKYKLTIMKMVKNKMVESPPIKKSKSAIGEKLSNNLQRSRDVIYQYAYCNKWDYFVTFTLDKTKANREDLKEFNHKLGRFFTYFNKKYNVKLRYLLIPELHSDLKSWHFHGFIANIPNDRIKEFKIGDKMR